MNNTMTLKIYLIQASSRGGGSSHDDVTEGTFCDDRSSAIIVEESDEDEYRVQREAIVMESTFKMRSCD